MNIDIQHLVTALHARNAALAAHINTRGRPDQMVRPEEITRANQAAMVLFQSLAIALNEAASAQASADEKRN